MAEPRDAAAELLEGELIRPRRKLCSLDYSAEHVGRGWRFEYARLSIGRRNPQVRESAAYVCADKELHDSNPSLRYRRIKRIPEPSFNPVKIERLYNSLVNNTL
jgi:hypothetical protein